MISLIVCWFAGVIAFFVLLYFLMKMIRKISEAKDQKSNDQNNQIDDPENQQKIQ